MLNEKNTSPILDACLAVQSELTEGMQCCSCPCRQHMASVVIPSCLLLERQKGVTVLPPATAVPLALTPLLPLASPQGPPLLPALPQAAMTHLQTASTLARSRQAMASVVIPSCSVMERLMAVTVLLPATAVHHPPPPPPPPHKPPPLLPARLPFLCLLAMTHLLVASTAARSRQAMASVVIPSCSVMEPPAGVTVLPPATAAPRALGLPVSLGPLHLQLPLELPLQLPLELPRQLPQQP